MTPATAAFRLGVSLLLGALLGLFYGFLRPMRQHRNAPADALFLLACLWLWLYLGFGLCAGDLRLRI